MGTKSTTTSTNQYNPQGMSAYNQMTPAMSSLNTQFMNSPFSNPQFQMQQLMGNSQANSMNQTGMNSLLQNMLGSGMAGGASNPAATEMLQNQSRAATGLQSQLGFQQPVNNALQRQQMAMGTAAGYQPLSTGNTQVKTTGGLGSWLPQVAGMGLGIAGAAMGMPTGLMSSWFNPANGGPGQQMPGFYSGANASPIGFAGTPGIVPSMGGGVPGGTGGSNPWFSMGGAPPPMPGGMG